MNGMSDIPGRDRRGVALPRIPHTVNSSTRSPQIKDVKMKRMISHSSADERRRVPNGRIITKWVAFRCRRGGADQEFILGIPHIPQPAAAGKNRPSRET